MPLDVPRGQTTHIPSGVMVVRSDRRCRAHEQPIGAHPRLGVLWRKNAIGCHSAARCRFVERMLTMIQTQRLQNRPVLEYLYRAIMAHRSGLPALQLMGQTGS